VNKRFTTLASGVMLAIVLLLGGTQHASAQEAGQVTVTCNGASITGAPEQVAAAAAALGCGSSSTAAPATPVGVAGQPNTCRVTTNSNIRSGPNTSYAVLGGARTGKILAVADDQPTAGWTKLANGWYIWGEGCQMVPLTIETAPRACNAYTRDDGFNMDRAISATDGNPYDVTIVSTLPTNPDGSLNFCYRYRTVQDGHESSIINDQIPMPGMKGDAPEWSDFTFLSNDWSSAQYAYYSGVAGRLWIDDDKDPSTPMKAVLDVEGKQVQYTENGVQYFTPIIGGWYAYQCRNCAQHWGFRLDRQPWTRPQ